MMLLVHCFFMLSPEKVPLKTVLSFHIHLTLCEPHHAGEQRCIMAKSPYCPQPAHTKADAWCKAAFWEADRATRPAAEGVFSLGFVSGFPSQSCPAETGSGGWRNLLYFSTAGSQQPPILPLFLLPSSIYPFFSLSCIRFLNLISSTCEFKGLDIPPLHCGWSVHGHIANTSIEV